MCSMPIELLEMCRTMTCDPIVAEALLSGIDVNARFSARLSSAYWYRTTLLAEAACAANVEMVQLLLKRGADPNLIPEEEPILYMLEYPEGEDYPDYDKRRLEIVEILLQNGADPMVKWDSESLLDDVCYEVFNHFISHYHTTYLRRLLLLLILYGGTSDYCYVRQYRPFDLSDTTRYQIFMIETENGKLLGGIQDDAGEVVAHF